MSEDFASLRIRIDTIEAHLGEKRLNKLQKAAAETEKATDSLTKSFRLNEKSALSVNNALRLAGTAAAFLSVKAVSSKIIAASDSYTRMSSQLTLVSESAKEASESYNLLFGIAQETRSELEPTIQLYTRLKRSTEELNLSNEELYRITTAINQSFKISGASSQESAAAITQLAQGLAAGVLRGDEFNSVMEQSPRLAQAIADELGVTKGALRSMAAEGMLTAEAVSYSLNNQADVIEAEYSKMARTVSQAMVQLQNDIAASINKADVSSVVNAIDDMRDIISDPGFQKNTALLASNLITGLSGAARFASDLYGWMNKIGKGLGFIAIDIDISAAERKLNVLGQDQANLIAKLEHKGSYWSDKQKGQIQQRIDLIGLEIEAQKKLIASKKEAFNDILKDEAKEVSKPNLSSNVEPVRKRKIRGVKQETEEQKKANKELEKSLQFRQNLIASLKEESETLGMSAAEIDLYRAKREGATQSEIAAIQAYHESLEIYQNQEAFKSLEDSLKAEEGIILESYKKRQELILSNTVEGSLKQTSLLRQIEEEKNAQLLEINGGFWEQYLLSAEEALTNFDDLAKGTIDQFSSGMGNAFESVVFDSQNLGDAFKSLTEGMARSLINSLGRMAAEWLAYKAVQTIVGKSAASSAALSKTAEAQVASQMAGLNAFASTAAIPIVGPALAPAAMTAAIAATQPIAATVAAGSAAMAGFYDTGGMIPAGKVGIVGEYGPEWVQGPANITSRKTTAENSKSSNSQSFTPTVIINNAPAGQHKTSYDPETMRLIVDLATEQAEANILDQMGNGGRVDDVMQSTYGVSRAMGAR